MLCALRLFTLLPFSKFWKESFWNPVWLWRAALTKKPHICINVLGWCTGKKCVFFRQAWISKLTLKVQTWVLLNLFSPTHKIWDPQIRNPWSFSCRKLSSTALCKLEQCWQTSQRYRPAMDSAGRFSLTQKLIDSPGETCGSFTFHVRTARARFEWSQALLQCVLAYSHVVTEPKPHSPTDTRLAYAVLILDHMFLKSHNRFSCLRPLFKSGVQIRIHCFVPVYPWNPLILPFCTGQLLFTTLHPVLLYFEASFKMNSSEYYTPDAQKNWQVTSLPDALETCK